MSKAYSERSAAPSSGNWHRPVLYAPCLEGLNIRPGGVYVDCTLGDGGHSLGIARRLAQFADKSGRLIAFDKDGDALTTAESRFRGQEALDKVRVDCIQTDFRNIGQVLRASGVGRVDGILADLGVSSRQLDQADRGFSYLHDGPLDMRMNRGQKDSAADLLARVSEEDLRTLLSRYGEERYAARIAAAIVRRRAVRAFERSADLAAVIAGAVPAAARRDKNPARRSFQAIRIWVNDELGALEALLDQAPELLNDRGRLCVISFHSLEDRIVKRRFRDWEKPCTCPPGLPCVCGRTVLGRCLERKGQTADEGESRENPRARSARLRVFERLRPDGTETVPTEAAEVEVKP